MQAPGSELAEPEISVSKFFAFLSDQYKMDKKISTRVIFWSISESSSWRRVL